MFLAIDCGNTTVEFAFFIENDLCCTHRVKLDATKSSDEYQVALTLFLQSRSIKPQEVDGALASSVVPSFNSTLKAIVSNVFGLDLPFVGPGFPSGIRINTDNPKEVGADLICDCAGAKHCFGYPCIIVDLGTASKVILLGKDGSFEGCVIAPGVGISLKALVGNAAMIGEVDIKIPAKHLGKNTADCISSALTYGNAYALTALADQIEKEAGYSCKRILTGGFGQLIQPLMRDFIYSKHLALRGIKAIFDRKK